MSTSARPDIDHVFYQCSEIIESACHQLRQLAGQCNYLDSVLESSAAPNFYFGAYGDQADWVKKMEKELYRFDSAVVQKGLFFLPEAAFRLSLLRQNN